MLPLRRFASQLGPSSSSHVKRTSLLTRLSERTEPSEPVRPRVTSFVSARSAQKRDGAAEKWFTDVRKLDVDKVDRPDPESKPRRKRTRPERHEMRPKTDLNVVFGSAVSARVQTRRELAGDYSGLLPDGHVDPQQLPVDYARLVLGRNRHIPLSAQTSALAVIDEAIRGRSSTQGHAI